jgi:hypothetical protein
MPYDFVVQQYTLENAGLVMRNLNYNVQITNDTLKMTTNVEQAGLCTTQNSTSQTISTTTRLMTVRVEFFDNDYNPWVNTSALTIKPTVTANGLTGLVFTADMETNIDQDIKVHLVTSTNRTLVKMFRIKVDTLDCGVLSATITGFPTA